MTWQVYKFLFYGTWGSVLIPLMLYLIRRSKVREIRIVASLLILSFIFTGLAHIGAIFFKTNVISNNIYRILAFIGWSWFYYEAFFKMRYKIAFVAGSVIFFAAFLIINFTEQNFLKDHQMLIGSVYKSIIFIYALAYFHWFVATAPLANPYKNSVFWINMGVLFCDGVAIAFYLMHSYNIKNASAELVLLVWAIFNISQIVQNILFAVGIHYSHPRFTSALNH